MQATATSWPCAVPHGEPATGWKIKATKRGPEAEACAVLRRHGEESGEDPCPDALATTLMDLFRRTGSSEVFEALVKLSQDQLRRRVRARTRFLGDYVDTDELLQDAYINIYRYPDRFDASRPAAFRAWSSTIVDNAVRRHVRRSQSGPDLRLRPVEILAQEPDRQHMGPGAQAMESEAFEQVTAAYRLFLTLYLRAYHAQSEREPFVLQMVEVRGMRYAQLADVLSIRPEALKMVVFRARRRILDRISTMLAKVPEPMGDGRTPVSCAG